MKALEKVVKKLNTRRGRKKEPPVPDYVSDSSNQSQRFCCECSEALSDDPVTREYIKYDELVIIFKCIWRVYPMKRAKIDFL